MAARSKRLVPSSSSLCSRREASWRWILSLYIHVVVLFLSSFSLRTRQLWLKAPASGHLALGSCFGTFTAQIGPPRGGLRAYEFVYRYYFVRMFFSSPEHACTVVCFYVFSWYSVAAVQPGYSFQNFTFFVFVFLR